MPRSIIALLLLLGACGSPTPDTDAASPMDANTTDDGSALHDAGHTDSGNTLDVGLSDMGAIDTNVGMDAAMPPGARGRSAPPTLGAQIDRVGRPGVNLITVDTFDPSPATRAMEHDAYNAAATPSGWATSFPSKISPSLAVFDALDQNCGNAPLYAGPPSTTSRTLLAHLVADDRLWLNLGGSASGHYLAVELDSLGISPSTDGGGRMLAFDVIDTTYSFFATGALTGLTDGVAPDADASGTAFPYLAAAH